MDGFNVSSTMGAAAGTAGGALSCGDNYAKGDYRLPCLMGTSKRKPWAAREYKGGGSGVHGNVKELKKNGKRR